MPSYALSTFLQDDRLTLEEIPSEKHPDGKAYTLGKVTAKTGLRLQRMMQVWGPQRPEAPTPEDLAELVSLTTDDDGEAIDFHVRLMGPAYQEMVDDGVSADAIHAITTLVMTHYTAGPQIAKLMVERAAGEALARANRATRRAAKSTVKKTAGSRSRRASGATTASAKAATSKTSASSPATSPPKAAKTG